MSRAFSFFSTASSGRADSRGVNTPIFMIGFLTGLWAAIADHWAGRRNRAFGGTSQPPAVCLSPHPLLFLGGRMTQPDFVLSISCPDRRGIVAEVTRFLASAAVTLGRSFSQDRPFWV